MYILCLTLKVMLFFSAVCIFALQPPWSLWHNSLYNYNKNAELVTTSS